MDSAVLFYVGLVIGLVLGWALRELAAWFPSKSVSDPRPKSWAFKFEAGEREVLVGPHLFRLEGAGHLGGHDSVIAARWNRRGPADESVEPPEWVRYVGAVTSWHYVDTNESVWRVRELSSAWHAFDRKGLFDG